LDSLYAGSYLLEKRSCAAVRLQAINIERDLQIPLIQGTICSTHHDTGNHREGCHLDTSTCTKKDHLEELHQEYHDDNNDDNVDDNPHHQQIKTMTKCMNGTTPVSSSRTMLKSRSTSLPSSSSSSPKAISTMTRPTQSQLRQPRQPSQPFDSKPYYTKVKPHITTQKRVQYVHLIEPTNKKAMPRDNTMILDGPVVYDHQHQCHSNKEREGANEEGEGEQIEYLYNDDDNNIDHEVNGRDYGDKGALQDGTSRENERTTNMNMKMNTKSKTRNISRKKKKVPLSLNPIFHGIDTF